MKLFTRRYFVISRISTWEKNTYFLTIIRLSLSNRTTRYASAKGAQRSHRGGIGRFQFDSLLVDRG